MKNSVRIFSLLLSIIFTTSAMASVIAGLGKADMTPPIGTPSAGILRARGKRDGRCARSPFEHSPFPR